MIYYLILLSLIIWNIKKRKKVEFYLWVGFYLFLLSAILSLFPFGDIAEFIARVALVFLLFGFSLSIKEYLYG